MVRLFGMDMMRLFGTDLVAPAAPRAAAEAASRADYMELLLEEMELLREMMMKNETVVVVEAEPEPEAVVVNVEAEPEPSPPPPPEAVRRAKRKKLRQPDKQELPREYREAVAAIGGDVEGRTLVIGKILTPTDMGKQYSRLNMPQGQIKTTHFLTSEEQELVCKKRPANVGGGGKGRSDLYEGVEVTLLDPSMNEHTMSLARWGGAHKQQHGGEDEKNDGVDESGRSRRKKSASWWLSLKKNWLKIAAHNGLKEGDAVQIWSFRFKADGRLGFVLHKLLPPEASSSASASTSGSLRRSRDEDQDDGGHKRKKSKTNVAETSTHPSSATPQQS